MSWTATHEGMGAGEEDRMGLGSLAGRIEEILAQRRRGARWTMARTASEVELVSALQRAASEEWSAYTAMVSEREGELSLWLFDLALAVAAAGIGDAEALLDALPRVTPTRRLRALFLDITAPLSAVAAAVEVA